MKVSLYSPISMPTSSEGIENTNGGCNDLINILLEKLRRRQVPLVIGLCPRQFRSTTIFRVENREVGRGGMSG